LAAKVLLVINLCYSDDGL